MCIAGYITDFSPSEIIQLLEKERKLAGKDCVPEVISYFLLYTSAFA
jgi:hypothetical protein